VKTHDFHSWLALTVELVVGAGPANIAKTVRKCTRFYNYFCLVSSKNPQISQIQRENITNKGRIPDIPELFSKNFRRPKDKRPATTR
jgi:hypothetical protein